MTDRDSCIALNMISGIGFVRFTALEKHFGSAGQAAGKSVRDYAGVPGISASVAEGLASADWQRMADAEKELADRTGVRILTLYDDAYPEILRQLYDPPLCLYVRGRLPRFPGRSLAIVGSRRMSRYGEGMTRAIAADAAAAGWCVVSGLAYGVDTVAHRTIVDCGGVTVAVLGGGLLHVHPQENVPLAQDIVRTDGAVVSEFPMDFPVSRTSFPRRNRIIAALTPGTLVVEAGVKSGALLTARAALEIGREVFAVPGQATNELARGCHQLIRDGAVLTECFEDISRQLDASYQPGLLPEEAFRDKAAVPYAPESVSDLDPVLAEVLKCIPGSGASVEELAEQTGMDTARLAAALMQLEFKFLIKRGADLLYRPER
ncbi:MAG: DNA-processing protein DprA [Lentisphaeria bacterium]|nr:DNA-processing protein DprA [Lentisphaeria bacterium]